MASRNMLRPCSADKKAQEIRILPGKEMEILPVGCLLLIDTRLVHIWGFRNAEHQAFAVLAEYWPLTPHLTLLPGG